MIKVNNKIEVLVDAYELDTDNVIHNKSSVKIVRSENTANVLNLTFEGVTFEVTIQDLAGALNAFPVITEAKILRTFTMDDVPF